jgi:hypothetical protein
VLEESTADLNFLMGELTVYAVGGKTAEARNPTAPMVEKAAE